jgi:hypothetical protein
MAVSVSGLIVHRGVGEKVKSQEYERRFISGAETASQFR